MHAVVSLRVVGLIALVLALVAGTAQAGIVLGGAANYAVLYEGNGNNHLNFNNGTISGDIGIGNLPPGPNTPQMQISGGAANTIIDGNVKFAGTANTTGTAGTDYTITAGHTISGNNPDVNTALMTVNSLSTTLGAEAGTSLAISVGNGATQTVNASSGMLDASGNRVFRVTGLSFVNGATLTINGGPGDSVVFNIAASDVNNPSFGGAIKLMGGITSDNVLFNITGTNSTLTISTNGATETGIFLDPLGKIQMNHSVLDGRLFGGDTQDMAIVSGASIFAPPPTIIPEPSSLAIQASLAVVIGCVALVRRKRRQAV
jgi:hypothetical protein